MKTRFSSKMARIAAAAVILSMVAGVLFGAVSLSQSAAARSELTPGAPTTATDDHLYRFADGDEFGSVVEAPQAIGFSGGTVTVTRSASVAVAPDRAVLDLAVEGTAATVAAARQSAAESMTALLAAIKEAGVADDDIATTMFRIQPETEWVEETIDLGDGETVRRGRSRLIGYTVRNGVTATVRDLDEVGTVIDEAAEAAGDNFRIPGIRFSAGNQAAAADQARELAAEDARRVAELYAESLGFVLGPVVEMTEYDRGAPLTREFAVAESAALLADTPIIPGDVDVSASVQVKFAILGSVQRASGE